MRLIGNAPNSSSFAFPLSALQEFRNNGTFHTAPETEAFEIALAIDNEMGCPLAGAQSHVSITVAIATLRPCIFQVSAMPKGSVLNGCHCG